MASLTNRSGASLNWVEENFAKVPSLFRMYYHCSISSFHKLLHQPESIPKPHFCSVLVAVSLNSDTIIQPAKWRVFTGKKLLVREWRCLDYKITMATRSQREICEDYHASRGKCLLLTTNERHQQLNCGGKKEKNARKTREPRMLFFLRFYLFHAIFQNRTATSSTTAIILTLCLE